MSVNQYYQKNIVNYKMNSTRKKHVLLLVPEDSIDILDIGCGQGELAKDLKARGKYVSGTDISSKALYMSSKYLDESFCFDVEDCNWPEELIDKKFDCIIASEVIEHLFQPNNFLANVKKLLKPQGVLILTTPNFLFWKNRFKMLFGKFEYEDSGFYDKGHISFFTRNSLNKELEKAGFQVEKELNFYPNLYRRGLSFLGNLFPGFFAYQLINKSSIKD